MQNLRITSIQLNVEITVSRLHRPVNRSYYGSFNFDGGVYLALKIGFGQALFRGVLLLELVWARRSSP